MKLGNCRQRDGQRRSGATTYRLAADAINLGHEVWVMSTGNLAYNPDDTIGAFARTVPQGRYTSARFLDVFKSDKAINKWITLDDLDVLLLRSNPSVQRAWAQSAGIHFGRLAMRHGVIVLNDPNGLSKAMNKLYLQTFPEWSGRGRWSRAVLSRIEKFLDEEGNDHLEAAAGFGRDGRVHRAQRRGAQPGRHLRVGQPRRLRDRPGVLARRVRRRHAAVPDERHAAAIQRQIRRLSPRPHR